LAHASNLRKEIVELLDQWVDESSAAMLARRPMDQRAVGSIASDVGATVRPYEEKLSSVRGACEQ
jgi:hypothetical protein